MKKQLKMAAMAVLSCSALFWSCKKDEAPKQYAKLNVFNMSPDAPGFNVQSDSTIVGPYVLLYGANTGYFNIEAGNRNLLMTTYRLDSTDTVAYRIPANLAVNQSFSLFLVDSFSKKSSLLVNDKLDSLSKTRAHLRFINLCPDTLRRADLVMAADSSTIFGNMFFRDVTSFREMMPGDYKWKVRYMLGDMDTMWLDIPLKVMNAGKAYTVILQGFIDGTGKQALQTQVATNQE
ncbi:MAG: DUF4397 domain-containing protein [Chitinophagaceae bacterium]